MELAEGHDLTVVIVDDDPMVRQNLSRLIGSMVGIRIVGECGDGKSAVQMVAELAPDVVLLDIVMPAMDGRQVARELVRRGVASRILALTALNDGHAGEDMLAAGATSVLSKAIRRDMLEAAVRATAEGSGVTSVAMAPRSIDRSALSQLKAEEREVLELLVAGMSNEEISRRTYVSVATVKKRIARLQGALGATGRVQLAVAGARLGLGQKN